MRGARRAAARPTRLRVAAMDRSCRSVMRGLSALMLGVALAVIQVFVTTADAAQAAKPRQNIIGIITDTLGRPLAGATVELQNAAGLIVAKSKSDAQGHFSFIGLATATYAVFARR